ncbi:hypothetical protein JYQ62_20160 [Nostoc sp. UHCC 0702]|nr:hypothetical protein JYQ62_20160 [Nostoc sp. UHCC 0702]
MRSPAFTLSPEGRRRCIGESRDITSTIVMNIAILVTKSRNQWGDRFISCPPN